MTWHNRCNKHVSEQRGFCALEPNHKDPCNVMPRIDKQGVHVPSRRKLVPAHYIKITNPAQATVTCLGSTFDDRGCGAKLHVSDLVYIQTHWYVPPSGCTDGDYWNTGEGQFVCPKCGCTNRLYERPEVEKLKAHFKKVEDKYR